MKACWIVSIAPGMSASVSGVISIGMMDIKRPFCSRAHIELIVAVDSEER